MFDFDLYDEYCFCCDTSNKDFEFMTAEEKAEEDYYFEEAKAEQEAENAWLRAAEAPTYDDYGFERWEAERGIF